MDQPLVLNARFASTFNVRAKRFALQAIAGSLLPGHRVNRCCKVPIGNHVEVWYSSTNQKAHYKKLSTCSSIWVCPVCASKITERRRVEIAKAMAIWPGSVFMVTFTLQHTRQDELCDLRKAIKAAYRELKSGRWYQDFEERYQITGSIVGYENTVSLAAGWHPHLHAMFFSRLPANKINQESVENEIYNRYSTIMAKSDRYVSPIYGVKVEKALNAQTEGNLAEKVYVAKWGLDSELAKSPVKAAKDENGIPHYSPFQLLELAGMGDVQAAAWFREYAAAMHGSKQLVWSRGLRSELGLEEKERTDEELAMESTSRGDVLLIRLAMAQWRVILANDARAELLNIADRGDPAEVKSFLQAIGASFQVTGSPRGSPVISLN